jgi:cell fate regulator YaaT (PSP1 superfamily)
LEALAPTRSGVLEITFKGLRREYARRNPLIALEQGDFAIVQTERGKECGEVTQLGDIASAKARDSVLGEVVRRATDEDLDTFWANAEKEVRARTFCLGRIAARRLDMKLVDVEWQFDSAKVTFYFTAEKRVDFRELVKDLASELRTRIELRQIGVRDEAKRRDGYGSCGRRLCCSSWLPEFQPITLKMARDQNLTVSPNKISGLCGRLLCCLSYEVGQYRDVLRAMPPLGALVKVGPVEGVVTKVEFFKRRIVVRLEDGKEGYIPDNAWRPEFLVSTRGGRREGAKPGAGGAAAAGMSAEPAEAPLELAAPEYAVPEDDAGDELADAGPDDLAGDE